MRGWLLFRVGIAALAVITGWLLSVLPLLPPEWQPRAPLVALLIVFVLYISAEYLHGVAGRRETEAYRNHVRNLQAFAKQAAALISRRQLGIAFPINIDSPIGKAFRQHFPRAAGMIDEWNEVTVSYQAKASVFVQEMHAEQARLNLGGSSNWASVLQAIVNKQFDLMDLTWSVQNNFILLGSGSMYTAGLLPTTAEATEKLLLEQWDSAIEIVSKPAAIAWTDANQRANTLWKPLRDELEPIEFQHDPRGNCDLCPK